MAATTAVQDVFRRALALSEEERRALLDLLSREFRTAADDEEFDDDFVAELGAIEAAMDAGTMKVHSQEDVREFVRKKLSRAN